MGEQPLISYLDQSMGVELFTCSLTKSYAAAGHACTLEVRAARDIATGEQLTISYLD